LTYNVTPQLPANEFTVAELFAGGGLMAVGLRAAGYDLVWANDFDKNAVKAYRHNLGGHIVQGDITAIDPADIPDTDVIAGGPPCQDYSVAGTGAGEDGERGKLVWAYLRIIEAKKPKAFIFENVKGLITKKHRPTFDAFLARFQEIGYRVSWQLINAWDYGVAQKRERVFIVGIREDLGFTFEFPEPRPEDYRTQVLRDVIGDLPEPIQETSTETVLRHMFPNHEPKPLSNHVKERLDAGGYAIYLKKHPMGELDAPSPTVTAHLAKGAPDGLVNFPQPRRFTVRECLRIQSVPDWYVLPDEISLSAQYRIVGNGVASRVAYLLGIALAEQLRAATDSGRIGNGQSPGKEAV